MYNYHKILKVFVREAYAAHLISENPYQNFKLDRGKRVARRFLTKEELVKLETKQIDDMCLNRVRSFPVLLLYWFGVCGFGNFQLQRCYNDRRNV